MAQRILKALHELSRDLGIAILTPEYEILVALLAEGRLSPEALCAHASISRSGFFHTIDRMKHRQLIACEVDGRDRRRKTYRLHPETAQMIVARLMQFRRMFALAELPRSTGDDAANGPNGARPRWRGDRVLNITCEYQVLLYLLAEPGASNGEIVNAVSASPTKAHAALARLVADGLVNREDDPADKRRKRYLIADSARNAVQRTMATIFSWLDEIGSAPGDEAPPNSYAPPPIASGTCASGR